MSHMSINVKNSKNVKKCQNKCQKTSQMSNSQNVGWRERQGRRGGWKGGKEGWKGGRGAGKGGKGGRRWGRGERDIVKIRFTSWKTLNQ